MHSQPLKLCRDHHGNCTQIMHQTTAGHTERGNKNPYGRKIQCVNRHTLQEIEHHENGRHIPNSSLHYGWKFINMKLPPAIQAMMNKGQERARQIQPRQFRNSNIKHLSPIDYITREWNALPLIIKRVPSINVLKKDLCKHFIGKY